MAAFFLLRAMVSIAHIRTRELGQAEVENLYLPALREKNVCRLAIAMNDVLRVRGIERIS